MIRKRPFGCIGLIAVYVILPTETYHLRSPINLFPIQQSAPVGRFLDDFIPKKKPTLSLSDWTLPHHGWSLYLASSIDHAESDLVPRNATETLNQEIARLAQLQQWKNAYKLLRTAEDRGKNKTKTIQWAQPNRESYSLVLQAMAASAVDDEFVIRADALFRRLLASPRMAPTRVEFAAILLIWSKSYDRRAGGRCEFLLTEHWRRYNRTAGVIDLCPTQSAYVSTMTALSRSGGGKRAAQRTETLLEDMERWSKQGLGHLKPTTTCVNIVLNAWSKSGAYEAADRSKVILHRMEDLYRSGRTELQPNTVSFNTVLHCLAQSRSPSAAAEAEQLLDYMDQWSKAEKHLRKTCRPDIQSFNSVLNAWARSRHFLAAERAEAIVEHMHQRYAAGNVSFPPDLLSYNTLLTAWSRSKNRTRGAEKAESILRDMEASVLPNGTVSPNVVSYNIVLNAIAQSDDPAAEERAWALLERMKQLDSKSDVASCRPDCITYNTLITLLGKQKPSATQPSKYADLAMELLSEAEAAYQTTGDASVKPNTRLYTSVVHTMARNQAPERAQAVVARMEAQFAASGDTDVQPDCICYDALVNAWGWSKRPGRSAQCWGLYQKMKRLYASRANVLAKPDIITCNSVLNACAFDDAETEEERQAILKIAVQMVDDFQEMDHSSFGRPNHITYANMLLCIDRHVLASSSSSSEQQRISLAETTFWHACERGVVSVLVLHHLHRVLPFARLAALLGDALLSGPGEELRFQWSALPSDWTESAPRPQRHAVSRPSRKMAARPKRPVVAK